MNRAEKRKNSPGYEEEAENKIVRISERREARARERGVIFGWARVIKSEGKGENQGKNT